MDYGTSAARRAQQSVGKRLDGVPKTFRLSDFIVRPILNGAGNEDSMFVRVFNPTPAHWAIYSADTRHGVLHAPVVGSFAGDQGVFEGTDTFEDRPICVRCVWSRITTVSPRWEQAFSEDGGKTWETNWVMDFTRIRSVQIRVIA